MAVDIRDVRSWENRKAEFKLFAISCGAEYSEKYFPDGKEAITVRQFFRPVNKKGENHESIQRN